MAAAAFPQRPFLLHSEAQVFAHIHPWRLCSLTIGSAFGYGDTLSQLCVWKMFSLLPAAHREPLCLLRVLPSVVGCPAAHQQALPRLHRSYGLMRQTTILPPTSVVPISAGPCRLSRIPAGEWPFPALSPRSLYGCQDPYHAAPLRCSRLFLPVGLRPHRTRQQFGTPDFLAMQLPCEE